MCEYVIHCMGYILCPINPKSVDGAIGNQNTSNVKFINNRCAKNYTHRCAKIVNFCQ